LSIHQCRLACAIFAAILACTLGCSQNATAPEHQPQVTPSPATGETGPWHMDLKVSPDHPRMFKPITFTLHITDDHAQPVNDAERLR
jgi:hypothetical protein